MTRTIDVANGIAMSGMTARVEHASMMPQVVGQFDSSPINLARITRDLIMAARASSSAANNSPFLSGTSNCISCLLGMTLIRKQWSG